MIFQLSSHLHIATLLPHLLLPCYLTYCYLATSPIAHIFNTPLYSIAKPPLTMSAPRKSIRKKRQIQLSFSPPPSSSPVASRYPDQIQRRAASVRYDSDGSSPAKRRRMEDSSPNKMTSSPLAKSIFGGQNIQVVVESPSKRSAQLPTPAASSQVEVKDQLHERGMHSVDPRCTRPC